MTRYMIGRGIDRDREEREVFMRVKRPLAEQALLACSFGM